MNLAIRQTLIGCAVTAMILALASASSAQTVEITEEVGSVHCGDVVLGANHAVSGGCPIHFLAESGLHTFEHAPVGGEVAGGPCTSSFTVRLDEDGIGYVTSQSFLGGSCPLAACDEAAPSHANREWPVTLVETGNNTLALLMTFCVRDKLGAEGNPGATCTVLLLATQIDHELEFNANEAPCFEDSDDELSVHWVSDTVFEAAEVIHTP